MVGKRSQSLPSTYGPRVGCKEGTDKSYRGRTTAFSLVAAQSNDTLVPLVFKPLPLSSVKPAGWLKDQLQLMSDGLAGHEHDFYAYVAHSSWLGGEEEYSSLNEGFPYWLNGLVPLAYSLDDARSKDQVHSLVQIVLSRQGDDG
ncbi:hypothetical protein LTR17_024556 [Elasticomyces elasticus]|nr:hypothetical protein LTR17_024556 [Elasticomyces elasticus]